MKRIGRIAVCLSLLVGASAFAKLPPPNDEAKAKAAEAKAKAAWGDKVAAYQLCKSQDKTAERYRKEHKQPPMDASVAKCEDPGPFVYSPPVPPSIMPGGAATSPALPANSEKVPQSIKK
ncbi:MAG TPA: hypothetical protein VN028_01505 [Rhodocyclaceae bacterium]|nr:hypothetical protein [Rhodocyclaceae bacterium]